MTTASLREKPVRDLARLAKRQGVPGWHAMRKDELIRALVRKARSAKRGASGKSAAPQPGRDPLARDAARSALVAQRIAEARERLVKAKSLASRPEGGRSPRPVRDRMVLMVRGPHWLHTFWEITPRSVERAQAALGTEWHSARPLLRVLQVESGMHASPSERVVREIEIHGGVKNWFIDIREPIRCRVEIGYRTTSGRFHGLARSNTVSTPAASHGDTLDAHWGDIVEHCEKIYAMSGGFSPENNSLELQELFEERLQRPLTPNANRSDGILLEPVQPVPGAELQVDAEMVVYGVTQPGMLVTLQGEPITVRPDGTFRVRVDLPNKRQVLPIVTSTPEGVERQTVVLAVERNTKVMEPVGNESED
ncbi:MAG: DUF4912 domain-containing protein [Planctomycetota bacterium]|jgi:hypothetical protein|nr:DUF4912 domain-containing protein [Planctomycetota bacterium]